MKIIRHGITERPAGLPRISAVVERGDAVYVCGVLADPGGDIKAQTLQGLERIDKHLAMARQCAPVCAPTSYGRACWSRSMVTAAK